MVCGGSLLSAFGCFNTVSAEKLQDTQRQLQLAQEQVTRLGNQLAEQEQANRTLQGQVTQLRGLSEKQRLEQLVVADRLQLASLSGGYDTDGKPGDDGLVLFVQPVDRDGDIIKAAGALKVTVFDLKQPPDRNVVAQYSFTPEAARKLWYGRLMTYHFTVRCPWPTGQVPVHDELTAYVAFTDLMTGKELTIQQAFKVLLPPRAQAGG